MKHANVIVRIKVMFANYLMRKKQQVVEGVEVVVVVTAVTPLLQYGGYLQFLFFILYSYNYQVSTSML